MQMRILALATLLAHFALPLSSVDAETISFTGRVDTVPEQLLSRIQPEMKITGSYTYDESLAVSEFLHTVTDFQMVIGDYSVGQDPTSTRGDISLKPNEYVVVSIATGETIADDFAPLLMALQLSSSSAIVDTTSPVPPPIEGFDNPLWTLDFSSTGLPLRVEGTIATLIVPEPSTGLLLASVGLFAAPVAARRVRRATRYSRKPNRR